MHAAPSLRAVSERFKTLFESISAVGAVFHPVLVDGATPMYILGVTGRVGINAQAMELELVDGADLGLYNNGRLYASPRLVKLLRRERLVFRVRCAIPG